MNSPDALPKPNPKLANKLKNDGGFYETACQTARRNFDVFFGEKAYCNSMTKIIKKLYK